MFDRLKCILFGHEYYVIQEFSKTERRMGCRRCGADWGMSDTQGCLVEWDSELEEMYEDMGHKIIDPKF